MELISQIAHHTIFNKISYYPVNAVQYAVY